MRKILLALQMWNGDRDNAELVADLLADLKKQGRYQFADIALITRFDCPDPSKTMIRRLETVFDKVWLHRSRRREVGYPGGCNGVWHDLMHWAYDMHKSKKMEYSAILTTEADAAPLAADWDEKLATAWHRHPEVSVMGFWHDSGSDVGHINGNALFDPSLVTMSDKLIGCAEQSPWDIYHAPLFKSLGWSPCKEIHSEWKMETIEPKQIEKFIKQGVVWLHGVKDASVREWVSSNLC